MGVAAGGRALAAPGDRDALLVADLEGEPHPDGDGEHRGQVADHRVEPHPRVAHVDVAVAALRRPVDAAHVLGEDAPGLDPARDVDSHVALQRSADVVRAHRGRDADRRALVAAPRVERPRDLALLVEDVTALLDAAGDQHAAVHPEQVLLVEARVLYVLQRLDRLGLADCHVCALPFPGRRSAGTLATRVAGGTAPGEPRRRPVQRLLWRARDGTGSRRNDAGPSATGSRSAPPAVTSPGTSRTTRTSDRRSARSARRRSSRAAPAATRACRRRSRSSAKSAAPSCDRTSSSAARSGVQAVDHARDAGGRRPASPAGRPGAPSSVRYAEEGGRRGKHGFPRPQNIVPTICEKRITVIVSSGETGRL